MFSVLLDYIGDNLDLTVNQQIFEKVRSTKYDELHKFKILTKYNETLD